MANEGKEYLQILDTYFPGTTIERKELKEKEKEGIVLHMGHEPLRKTYTSQAERMIAEAVKNKQ